jgi:hypothetical protein
MPACGGHDHLLHVGVNRLYDAACAVHLSAGSPPCRREAPITVESYPVSTRTSALSHAMPYAQPVMDGVSSNRSIRITECRTQPPEVHPILYLLVSPPKIGIRVQNQTKQDLLDRLR